jgi:CcmD family protein
MRKTIAALACSIMLTGPTAAMQPPAAQGEFVPAQPGTATEQLPAAPLVIAAYAFVWIAGMGYVWTIARRLQKVEDDLRALERKTTRTTR